LQNVAFDLQGIQVDVKATGPVEKLRAFEGGPVKLHPFAQQAWTRNLQRARRRGGGDHRYGGQFCDEIVDQRLFMYRCVVHLRLPGG